ncbi:MAG: hypothetical protein ACT4QA_22445 [Panacagrimonas sp.]
MASKSTRMKVAAGLLVAGATWQCQAQAVDAPLGDPRLGKADEAAARAATSTEAFDTMDRNKDGGITPSEATGLVAASFDNVDASRDGKVDYAEFVQLEDSYRGPDVPVIP